MLLPGETWRTFQNCVGIRSYSSARSYNLIFRKTSCRRLKKHWGLRCGVKDTLFSNRKRMTTYTRRHSSEVYRIQRKRFQVIPPNILNKTNSDQPFFVAGRKSPDRSEMQLELFGRYVKLSLWCASISLDIYSLLPECFMEFWYDILLFRWLHHDIFRVRIYCFIAASPTSLIFKKCIFQKIRTSTRRLAPLQERNNTTTTPNRRKSTSEVDIYSPFHIETPTRSGRVSRRSNIKTW